MKYKFLIVVIFLLIVAIVSGLMIFGEEPSLKLAESDNTHIEAPTERIWVDDFLKEEIDLHTDIDDSLYRALSIKKSGNYLYVIDFGDMQIKRFGLKGNYIDKFGNGKGRGPGEFTLIMDSAVSPDNKTLYALDSRKKRLMVFDAKTTDYLTAYDTEYNPYRLTATNKKVVVYSIGSDSLFKIHSTNDGHIEKEFGNYIENQLQNPTSTYGNIALIDDDQGFITAPTNASFIFYYDFDGNLLKTIETPGRIPFKKGIREGKMVQPAKSPVAAYSLRTHADAIFQTIFRKKSNTFGPSSFTDIYNLQTGEYQFSFEMPFITTRIAFSDETVYLLNSDTDKVRAYNYNRSAL